MYVHIYPLQSMSLPYITKILSPGRVIIIYTHKYQYSLAIILQESSKYSKQYKCLILCDSDIDNDTTAKSLLTSHDNHVIMPYQSMNKFYKPVGEEKHVLLDIPNDMIIGVLQSPVSVNARRILSDYSQRQLPRFM